MTLSRTKTVAAYLADAAGKPLSDEVRVKTTWHVLDTLAAGISGSRLLAGVRAKDYVRAAGQAGTSVVWGDARGTDMVSAAFANGMSSHADETDDSHAGSVGHPGCAVVPAAFAVANSRPTSGAVLLRAVAAGYDVGPRVMMALGKSRFEGRQSNQNSHAYGGLFGAAAAAGVVMGLSAAGLETVLSYSTQMTSGVSTWLRDPAHVEKAYVFGGMPARNGVFAATLAAAGFEGVPDAFDLVPNFLDAISDSTTPELLVDGLGERFEIMATNIKKYAVGSPAQAAVQAAEILHEDRPDLVTHLASIEIALPANAAHVVDDRSMPDINVQYLVAGTLLDGRFTFAMAHDPERMDDPEIQRLRRMTTLVSDEASTGTRSAVVTLRLTGGEQLRTHVPFVRGTTQDPMELPEVEQKCTDLLDPVLGAARTRELIDRVLDLDAVEDISSLIPLLRVVED
jgi:2-methylcitrate dehydratase PrpD